MFFSKKNKTTAPPSTSEQPTAEEKKSSFNIGSLFMGDRVIWTVYFFLCVISLVEVFSAASTLSYKTGDFWQPLIKQALYLGLGTVLVIIIHRIPCRMFKILPIFILPLSILLLLVTLLSGAVTNEAARWMRIGGIQFQPSEIAKGAMIITTALILSRMQGENGAYRKACWWITGLAVVVCGLILPENLSTAALLFGVVYIMMFIGRVPLVQLGKLFGCISLIGVVVAVMIYFSTDIPFLHRFHTWKERIETHISGDEKGLNEDPKTYDIDKDAQVAHANIAIATSNVVGKLPGNSVQRDFLSQAFSDFIFAVIIEEMGLWGAAIVVMLYIVLLFRAGRIASRCERNFPPFLIMGLTLLLASQAMLNMMVAVGLFPVTGQTLPLISRGGTSTFICCIYIGMILSVSRYAKQVKTPQHTQFDGPMTDVVRTEGKSSAKPKAKS